jgi:hypothetical protein
MCLYFVLYILKVKRNSIESICFCIFKYLFYVFTSFKVALKISKVLRIFEANKNVFFQKQRLGR